MAGNRDIFLIFYQSNRVFLYAWMEFMSNELTNGCACGMATCTICNPQYWNPNGGQPFPIIAPKKAELPETIQRKECDYILSSFYMSNPAKESWDKFLDLVKHGAKFIDIHVRKDSKEYHFQADFLKYIKKAEPQSSEYPDDK